MLLYRAIQVWDLYFVFNGLHKYLTWIDSLTQIEILAFPRIQAYTFLNMVFAININLLCPTFILLCWSQLFGFSLLSRTLGSSFTSTSLVTQIDTNNQSITFILVIYIGAPLLPSVAQLRKTFHTAYHCSFECLMGNWTSNQNWACFWGFFLNHQHYFEK